MLPSKEVDAVWKDLLWCHGKSLLPYDHSVHVEYSIGCGDSKNSLDPEEYASIESKLKAKFYAEQYLRAYNNLVSRRILECCYLMLLERIGLSSDQEH